MLLQHCCESKIGRFRNSKQGKKNHYFLVHKTKKKSFLKYCRRPGSCAGTLVDFADLPQSLTLQNDPAGVITNFLGPWHGLSVHGFHGVWAAPNASLIIPNAARCGT